MVSPSRRSCRVCCGNSLAACSGHVKVRFLRRRGQGASARWAERGFPSHRPCASGSGRRPAAPRAAPARRRAGRSWGLDPAAELLIQALDGVGGPGRFPLRRIEAGEGEEPVCCFLQAVGHRPALEPPLAQEGFAAHLDLGRGVGVDHVPVVLGQLVVHVFRGMGQEVAVLVNRASAGSQLFGPTKATEARLPGPVQPSTITNSGSLQARAQDRRGTWRQAPCFSPPMFLMVQAAPSGLAA